MNKWLALLLSLFIGGVIHNFGVTYFNSYNGGWVLGTLTAMIQLLIITFIKD